MKKYIAPLGLIALLLAGCSGEAQPGAVASPSATPSATAKPTSSLAPTVTAEPTSAAPTRSALPSAEVSEPAPATTASEATSAASQPPAEDVAVGIAPPTEDMALEPPSDDAAFEDALSDALTPPTSGPNVNPAAGLEDQYLEVFYQELAGLPDGPYVPVGGAEALALGRQACVDLSASGYADALLGYAFSDGVTEDAVANYNAALNVAPFAMCQAQD